MKITGSTAVGGALSLYLSGCGFTAPPLAEPWHQGPDRTQRLVFEIRRRIYCDLQDAVQFVNDTTDAGYIDIATGRRYPQAIIPKQWGARISLQLQVDETSSVSPGVTLIKPLENALTRVSNAKDPIVTAQFFNLGLGGTLSGTATRLEKFESFYTVGFLMQRRTKNSICLDENDPFANTTYSSPFLTSDLALRDWLKAAVSATRDLPSDDTQKVGPGTLPDTFSVDLKFRIETSGNVNPSWKLVRVTSNTSGLPLFAAGRTRTHDVLITIGPQTKETTNSYLASQIGQAVGASVRNF